MNYTKLDVEKIKSSYDTFLKTRNKMEFERLVSLFENTIIEGIGRYNVPTNQYEDFLQEGRFATIVAIKKAVSSSVQDYMTLRSVVGREIYASFFRLKHVFNLSDKVKNYSGKYNYENLPDETDLKVEFNEENFYSNDDVEYNYHLKETKKIFLKQIKKFGVGGTQKKYLFSYIKCLSYSKVGKKYNISRQAVQKSVSSIFSKISSKFLKK